MKRSYSHSFSSPRPSRSIRFSQQTRIQISSEFADLGMFGTIKKVSGEEGVLGLWKGVNAAWLREASYTSLRLGLYEPIKVLFGANDPATATFAKKFLAGSAAGAIGSVAGNPVRISIRLVTE